MSIIYVQDRHGKPLAPTTRGGHVRRLLDSKQARVVCGNPFTIRLMYGVDPCTQGFILGIDPGRTNIGVTVAAADGTCVFSAKAETNNKDVPKRMKERKAHRQASRQGERKRRQRRARKNGTCFGERKRILPGCKEPITNHYITNTEARFMNRARTKGWLTPTANQLLQSTISLVRKVCKFLPVTDVVLELNEFAFMAMDDPGIQRWEYQKGPLYGYGSVEAAVYTQQDGHCIFCEQAIAHCHHVIPASKGGSDTLENRAGLCGGHHDLVHKEQSWTDKLAELKAGMNKRYAALSVVNQIIPRLADALGKMFPGHAFATNGWSTKQFRDAHGIPKDHNTDADCIACSILENPTIKLPEKVYELRKFRRHDRAQISRMEDRNYYLPGADPKTGKPKKVLAAKNRHKRTEQKTDSLEEFRAAHPNDVGRLMVARGGPKHKDPNRVLPGAIFQVETSSGNVEQLVLQGSHGRDKNGQPLYMEFVGQGNFRPNRCKYVARGRGWQFV